MAIADEKERISITVPIELLQRVDRTAERFGMTRSEVFCLAFEQSEETIELLDKVGMSPEALRAISDAVAGGVRRVVNGMKGKGGKGRKGKESNG